ncbi:hypothetical protein H0H92_010484, partial [Tricholoma furcatifolium]
MSNEQRREVDERMKNARVDDGVSSAESQDEAGPSKDKGKGTDPRNWGNLDFLSDEVDPEVQRQIMQACNDIMRENKKKLHVSLDVPEEPNESEAVVEETIEDENPREDLKKKLRLQKRIKNALRKRDKNIKKGSKKDKAHRAASEPLSHELEEMIGQLTDVNKRINARQSKEKLRDTNRLDPVNQITKDSALGRAFQRMRNDDESSDSSSSESSSSSSSDDNGDGGGGGDSSDDSDSSESSSDSDSSESSSSSSEDGEGSRRRRHGRGNRRHRRARGSSRRRRRSGSRRQRKSLIKPTPPTTYNGMPDIQKFMQFLTHGTAYVKYGRVERRRRVLVLSQHLEGKAWTFYAREVSRDPESWTMDRFFKELFNECFPVDFRNRQRNKLKDFGQGRHTVKEYVAALRELFTLVGSTNQRDRIVKLFNGFRPSIQRDLYRKGLNPETSSWKRIVKKAEHAELA